MVPTCDMLMRVSLIAEACVSLRLTLELFCSGSYVALVFIIAMLNKIVQKKNTSPGIPLAKMPIFSLAFWAFMSAI